MSEYSERKDLIRRALYNYKHEASRYEVTRLLETLCFCLILIRTDGGLVIPRDILAKVELEKDISSEEFIRHMRNSFCHLHYIDSILAKTECDTAINKVTFIDISNGSENFRVELSVSDLENLLEKISEYFFKRDMM